MQPRKKSGDRRANRRYKVVLEVHWKIIHRKRVVYSGTGLTVDFSSGGIQFDTDEPPAAGRTIEMSIAWPALLDGTIPLRLVAKGLVVRTNGRRVAVGLQRYEFRTAE